MRLSHLIPSMFIRRLLLLGLGMAVCALVPVAQMARLTLAKGPDLRADAEKRLVTEAWTDTSRGRILDRKGREVARDRPSFDIAVDYAVISGKWVDQKAFRAAKRRAEHAGRSWAALSAEQRQDAIAAERPPFEQHWDGMWSRFAQIAGLPREEIDRRRAEIVQQVQYLTATVTERQRLGEQERRLREGLPGEVQSRDVRVTVEEQRQAHVVLHAVPEAVGFAFDRVKDLTTADEEAGEAAGRGDYAPAPLPVMPGLRVLDAARRDYPFDSTDVDVDTSVFPPPVRSDVKTVRVKGVATHVLGRMRDRLFREDIDRRPRTDPRTGLIDPGHYRPGDAVGQTGVEQAQEDVLRGLRGLTKRHLDTGLIETTPPTPGRDVQLTLDIALQARIQALFDPALGLTVVQEWQRQKKRDEPDPKKPLPKDLPIGTPLNGAVVVMDVATGDVLALVTMPTFSHEQLDNDRGAILTDTYNQAFLNRAIDRVYPPGSIVKPLVLCSAIEHGLYSPEQRIACTGHFYPDKPLLYRCWIYKQFHTTHSDRLGHDLDGADGIRCSCNIFFFEMGRRLGVRAIEDMYTSYGVGDRARPFNLFNLPPLPDEEYARSVEVNRRRPLNVARGQLKGATPQEGVLMGIGQGPVTWTPLHAATAYAALARGGVLLTPRLIEGAPQERRDLGLPPRAVAQALKGLYGSANEDNGTTHTITYPLPGGGTRAEPVFTAPGITVWAKSGTAATNPFSADLTADGDTEEYDGDHAWCVCLAGVGDKPQYAIACVVDHGGSGGKVSGPLANQVVHALIAEGYLPDLRERDENGAVMAPKKGRKTAAGPASPSGSGGGA